MANLTFTQDWFTARAEQWSVALKDFNILTECHYLELGTYEGRSLIWMLENILKNSKSTATCIDVWNDKEIERRFLQNISKTYFEKVKIIKSYIQDIIGFLYHTKKYDIIYIDADHRSNTLLLQASMCFDMCKVGGIIIFDDYLWPNSNNSPVTMKEAIDCFLKCYNGYYETILCEYQVIIKKIK